MLGLEPAIAQDSAALFDDGAVQDVWLEVDPANWAKLRQDYLLNTYYPARFTYNEHSVPVMGIRSRGSGSRSPEKPNLLLSFDRYDKSGRLLGLTGVVLKANNQDASLLREILVMKLLRRMGVPAPREALARLFVNGEYFGSYVLVERIDSSFLDEHFGENDGYLYEWEAVRTDQGYRFEWLGSDPANYTPVMWSPSNNESSPEPGPIVELTDLVNHASDEEFAERIEEYVNVDNLLRMVAVENTMGDFDGFLGTVFGMNNFYAYRPVGTKRFSFISWDKDGTFDSEYKPIDEGVDRNVLMRRLLALPWWRNAWLSYVADAATRIGGHEGWLAGEIERLYSLVRESAYADVHKQCGYGGGIAPCGVPDFEAEVDKLRHFAVTRSGFVLSEAAAAGYVEPPEGESRPAN